MRYLALFLPLAVVAGCTTGGQAPADDPAALAKAREAALKKGHLYAPGGKSVRYEHDTEAAHRARHFYLQGVRLLKNKRIDESIREFQLAIQAYPLYFKAHFKLGFAYYHKGLYDLEIAEYKKCLAINQNYLPAQLNLGHAFLARDKLEEARDAYRKVISLEHNHAVARYNLGLVEFDLRDFDRSEKHLEAFLRTQTGVSPMTEQAKKCLQRIREKRKEAKSK